MPPEALVPFATLPPGSRVGRFQVVRVLGQGGMGVVYEALDTAAGRSVALKVLPRELADERYLERFRREGATAAAVSHPNVVKVWFAGDEGGLAVIALELVKGGTLKAKLKTGGALPWREAVRVSAEVARGLSAIHAAGLVHRDLKPENVLLDGDGAARVADFGLVAQARATAQQLTRTGEMLGTLEYVSPEQANDSKRVDSRADLYSLGALVHALIAGRPPFEGQGYALVKKHLEDRPPALRAFVPDVPPRLERLVLQLLEKDPAARPASALEVAQELDAIGRAGASKKASARRALLPLAGLVLLVGGVIGGGVALVRRGGGAAATPPTSAPPPPPPPPPSAEKPARRSLDDGFRAGPGFKLQETWGRHDWKHATIVTGISMSADGTRAATGSADGTAKLWDLASGHELWSAKGSGPIGGVALSPEGDAVLIGDATGNLWIASAADGHLVRKLDGHGGEVHSVAWSPDGATLLTSGGHLGPNQEEDELTHRVWDAKSGTLLRTLPPARCGFPNEVAFVDASRAVGAMNGKALIVWDLPSGSETKRIPTGDRIRWASATKDGRHAVAANILGTVELFDLETGESRSLAPRFQFEANCAAVARDGSRVIAGGREGFKVWTGRGASLEWEQPTPNCFSVAITADGKRALTGDEVGVLRFWDLDAKHELGARAGFDGAVRALAWERRKGVSGVSQDQRSVGWRSRSGDAAKCEVGQYAGAPAVYPDGRVLVVQNMYPEGPKHRRVSYACRGKGEDADLRWDSADALSVVLCSAFSPDGSRIAYGDSKGVVEGGEDANGLLGWWRGTHGAVNSLVFLDDNKRWLAGSETGAVTVGLAEGVDPEKPLDAVGWHQAPVKAVAARLRRGLTGDAKGGLKLWDLEPPRLAADLAPPGEKGITAVAFSESGRLAAAASEDGTIVVWKTVDRTRVATIDLKTSSDQATALCFESDRFFHAGTARGVVHRFEVLAGE